MSSLFITSLLVPVLAATWIISRAKRQAGLARARLDMSRLSTKLVIAPTLVDDKKDVTLVAALVWAQTLDRYLTLADIGRLLLRPRKSIVESFDRYRSLTLADAELVGRYGLALLRAIFWRQPLLSALFISIVAVETIAFIIRDAKHRRARKEKPSIVIPSLDSAKSPHSAMHEFAKLVQRMAGILVANDKIGDMASAS